MNQIPFLLVIGAKEHTLKKLKAMSINYLLIQSEKDPLRSYYNAKKVFVEDYNDIEKISQIAENLHQSHQFRAVVSFTELGLYPAALIAEQLNLKGNAVFPVQHTRDKFKMRDLLEKHQLSSILYQKCSTLEDVTNFYKKINAPFILKPINGAGSQGVYYVESLQMINNAWNWAINHDNQGLIAEEYLLGQEYSVESLSLDGQHQIIAITEKLTTKFPHFIELGHHSPAHIDQETKKKIYRVVLRFLDIIQHQNGPTHTEIKVHLGDVKIIESQTRMGGDQIWELTELTTGVDVISETVIHLLELNKKSRDKKTQAAAILFFAREFEEIIDIKGLETAKKLPGIIRIECSLQKGQKLSKLISSQSRQGYILGKGNNINEAISAVDLAMKQIQIKTKAHFNKEME